MSIPKNETNNKERNTRTRHRGSYLWLDHVLIDQHLQHLSGPATKVYLFLCRHADKDQYTYWAQETMAALLDMHRVTVNKATRQLKEAGLIEVEKQDSDSGKWQYNGYFLIEPPCSPATTRQRKVTAEAEPCSRMATRHAENTTGQGPCSPEATRTEGETTVDRPQPCSRMTTGASNDRVAQGLHKQVIPLTGGITGNHESGTTAVSDSEPRALPDSYNSPDNGNSHSQDSPLAVSGRLGGYPRTSEGVGSDLTTTLEDGGGANAPNWNNQTSTETASLPNQQAIPYPVVKNKPNTPSSRDSATGHNPPVKNSDLFMDVPCLASAVHSSYPLNASPSSETDSAYTLADETPDDLIAHYEEIETRPANEPRYDQIPESTQEQRDTENAAAYGGWDFHGHCENTRPPTKAERSERERLWGR